MSAPPTQRETSSDRLERKLAAILSADVQGYSRLMSEDEEATIRTLTTYRDVFSDLVTRHHGRVVDSPGDNILAEFASAVEAVQCAVNIQQALQQRNAELLPHRQMLFRIGINLGDVLVEGERIYGDGVNIAARIEGLAEGGGICISGTVYDQLEGRLSFHYRALGEQQVKNITRPVRVYRVLAPLATSQLVADRQDEERRQATGNEQEEEDQKAKIKRQKAKIGTEEREHERAGERERGRTGNETLVAESPRRLVDLSSSNPPSALRPQPLSSLAPSAQHPTSSLVGREKELSRLHRQLEKALCGERQVVFVTGEPGIGKTALVDAFVAQIANRRDLWISRGQCVEHYGPGEAYLPLLEAGSQLGRTPGGERLIEVLRAYAPTWLAQLPSLVDAASAASLQRSVQSATRERMLRESADAITVLAAEQCLVIVLEDLHWSDASTVEWIAYLAQRREPVRLLIIGTYRPGEVVAGAHPLRGVAQELLAKGRAKELSLPLLRQAEVGAYVAARFDVEAEDAVPLQSLVKTLHRRTSGNPLFMVTVVEHLLRERMVVREDRQWRTKDDIVKLETDVPDNLRRLIETHLEALNAEEQQMLAVGSVAGAEFAVATVAAVLQRDIEAVETRCADLASKGQFLRAAGVEEWPDGAFGGRYGFLHALYQNVVYDRVSEARRIQLHRRIGERKEAAYGERAAEIAGELAVHFEKGRDYQRSAHWLEQAGANAAQRHAHQEAIRHLTKGLALLRTLPITPERLHQEISMQCGLGLSLSATRGYSAPEVGRAYTQAWELCLQVGETPHLFPVLRGLWVFHLVRAELLMARVLGERLLDLAKNQTGPDFVEAHQVMGLSLFYLGELAPALRHLEQSLALYNSRQHRAYASPYGQDQGVVCLSYKAWMLWLLGYPDQARERSREALGLAEELAHPFSHAFALNFAALLAHFRREGQATQAQATSLINLSTDQGFAFYVAHGTILQGGGLAEEGQTEEGIALMLKGLEALQATEAALRRPYYLAVLAAAYGRIGQAEEGLTLLTTALGTVSENMECIYEAELHRLYGELLLRRSEEAKRGQGKREFEGTGDKGTGERESGRTGDEKLVAESPRRFVASSSPNPQSAFRNPHFSIADPQPPSSPTQHLVLSTQHSSLFRCEGEYWTLAFDGAVCRLRDMRGLHYLAQLLQHPNEELHAFRLATGDSDPSTSGEIFDPQAWAAYKRRPEDLQAELEEASAFNDHGRIDKLRNEIDFLTQALAQAVGLGGQARRAGSPAERARTTVTKAIKNALKKINDNHPALGRYLTRTIKTGTFCAYAPDPRAPITWCV